MRYLINSHLHFDHTGGNAEIPNARLVVQRREWEAGHDADQIRKQFYNPRDYQLGHDVLAVDGEHDLFGDGRIVCFPTYGHTPGHQSLRLQLDARHRRPHRRRLLPAPHARRDAPAVGRSTTPRPCAARSQRLRALRDAGARIIYGHDPEDWAHGAAGAGGGVVAPASLPAGGPWAAAA